MADRIPILRVFDDDGNEYPIPAIQGRKGDRGDGDMNAADYDPQGRKEDIFAALDRHTHSLESLGAAAEKHTHTVDEVSGVAAEGHTHNPADLGALAMMQGAENAGLFLVVGDDGMVRVSAAPSAKFSNGPFVVTESQTIDFTKHGLRAGDQVNVICIGGGGGGQGSGNSVGYSHSGGDAGKGGEGSDDGNFGAFSGGGGGGGYGGGGGGAGGGYGNGTSGAGGYSGCLSAATITLKAEELIVDVTVGEGGKGGAGGDKGSPGTKGEPSSFGAYLSADGGDGGGTPNGKGGHAGGHGQSGGADGGGGGGGWIVASFGQREGTDGEPQTVPNYADGCGYYSRGGSGGTGGGRGGITTHPGNNYCGNPGEDAANVTHPGRGAVIYWY